MINIVGYIQQYNNLMMKSFFNKSIQFESKQVPPFFYFYYICGNGKFLIHMV